jgi:hypothetical protein
VGLVLLDLLFQRGRDVSLEEGVGEDCRQFLLLLDEMADGQQHDNI